MLKPLEYLSGKFEKAYTIGGKDSEFPNYEKLATGFKLLDNDENMCILSYNHIDDYFMIGIFNKNTGTYFSPLTDSGILIKSIGYPQQTL